MEAPGTEQAVLVWFPTHPDWPCCPSQTQLAITSSRCKHLYGFCWLPHTCVHFGCCCPRSRSGPHRMTREGEGLKVALPWSLVEEVMDRDAPVQQTHCTFIFMWIFCFAPTSYPGISVLLKHFLSLSTEDPHMLTFPAPSPPRHPGQFISPFLHHSMLSGLSPDLLFWACQNSFTATAYERANSYKEEA